MAFKLNTDYKRRPYDHRGVAIGDSLTLNYSMGLLPDQFYCAQLTSLLQNAGCGMVVRNWGISGDTTPGMLGRAAVLTQYESTPDLGIVWGGANDVSTGSLSGGTLTSSGSTATITAGRAYYMPTGSTVIVTGANQAYYNGTFTVTQISATTWTYTMSGSPGVSPATGAYTIKNELTQTQIQANLQALVKCLKFGAIGAVADQTQLPIGVPTQRYIVMSDGSSTGGFPATGAQTSNITGSGGSAQTVWEYRLPKSGEYGWGRVATINTAATNCKNILVIGAAYMNWSSGGDTQTSVPSTAFYATQIAAQTAAASSESVMFVDSFNYFKNLIASGYETQGSFSWHVQDIDQHFNPLGHQYQATNIYTNIPNGWIAAWQI